MADDYAEHWNAGNACYERGELDAARDHFARALELAPNSVPARYNLGVVHRDLENWETAWILFIDVIARDKNAAAAYNNLAISKSTSACIKRPRRTIGRRSRSRTSSPTPTSTWGCSCCGSGDGGRALSNVRHGGRPADSRRFGLPIPSGTVNRSKGTLLVHSEQGAGDAIQFVRFLPLAAERCDRILFVCPERLHRLFQSLPGVSEMRGPGPLQYSEFAAYIPLMSLPRALGSDLENFPRRGAVLAAACASIATWSHRRLLIPGCASAWSGPAARRT